MSTLGIATDFEWRRERALEESHGEALREHAQRQERRALTYEQFQGLGLVAPPNTTGVSVTPLSAFQVSAWWCGIDVISSDISVLDFDLYKRLEGDDREKVKNHPVAKLLEQPNKYMVPSVFWQTVVAHALGWGNAYCEIEWDNAMRPIAVWPIWPTDIEPIVTQTTDARGRRQSVLKYRYRGQDWIEPEDIWHLPGPGFDGIRGYPVWWLAQQSLGLSIAAERFSGSYFGNGTWMGLVLEHPGRLSDPGIERIRNSVQSMHQGAANAFKIFVAEEGMKLGGHQVTTKPSEAQMVESREHQIAEVARWLNMPIHKLKHRMGERPGGNLEASETDYHTTTLLPWTTRIGQVTNQKLISAPQRSTFYVEHNFSRRLQSTPKDRMVIQQGYQKMGVLTTQQIARQENLPQPEPKAADITIMEKIEALGQLVRAGFDPAGSLKAVGLPDIAHTGLLPVTVQPEDEPSPAAPPAGDPPPAPPQDEETPPASRAVSVTLAQRTALAATVARYIRREAQNAQRAAKRGPQAFQAWADTFYSPDERAVLSESLEPVVALCAATRGVEGDPAAIADEFAGRYMARSKAELLGVRAKDLETAVPALLKKWETSRALEGVEELMAALGAAEEKEHVA